MTNDQIIIRAIFGVIILIIILAKTGFLKKISIPKINGGGWFGWIKHVTNYQTVFLLLIIYVGLQVLLFSMFADLKLWEAYRESNVFYVTEVLVFALLWLYTKEGYKKLAVFVMILVIIASGYMNHDGLKDLFNKHTGPGDGDYNEQKNGASKIQQMDNKLKTIYRIAKGRGVLSEKIYMPPGRKKILYDKDKRYWEDHNKLLGIVINDKYPYQEERLPNGNIADLDIPNGIEPEFFRFTCLDNTDAHVTIDFP